MEPVARPLLPVIFVLDTSGSMEGQPISMLNHCMEEVVRILGDFASSNADALLKIGVLQVHSGARWLQPAGLEELGDFVYSKLVAGGLTDMGAALDELDSKLSREAFLQSTTGRCKPIIIFMTDGMPTDDWERPLDRIWKTNKWYRNSIKIGFAVGDGADAGILTKIVGNPEAVIKTSDLATFSILLQKVAVNSAMVGSKSHVAGDTPDGSSIVKISIDEAEAEGSAVTAGDMGITDDAPAADGDDDAWGGDWD